MYSLDISFRNDEELIQRNISKGISKIGRKYFIQFDNAAFYKNKNMKELLKKTKGIAPYNDPGRSLDNRPIEFHWSILKIEYIRGKIQSMKELEELFKKICFITIMLEFKRN